MVTTKLEYSHTIGIASFEGRGFMNPIDIKYNNGNYMARVTKYDPFWIFLKYRPKRIMQLSQSISQK